MFKRILVPLDGSALAERALQPAVTVAQALDASLILLQAAPQFTLTAVDPALYNRMARFSEAEAQAYLRTVCVECPASLPVEVVAAQGAAAETIIDYAASHAIDLIVMSSHGRSGVSRWVYGSVAEKVLRQAPCAVLIICARSQAEILSPTSPSRLLVPLDGSELAERALPPAMALAEKLPAEVHLLRVTEPAHVPLETQEMSTVFDEIAHQERSEAERYLQQQYNRIPNDHLFLDVRTARRSVADTIIDYAASHAIDLIVMSSHGRSGLQRWVYGSVAEKVLRGACCATMIVTGEPSPEKSED